MDKTQSTHTASRTLIRNAADATASQDAVTHELKPFVPGEELPGYPGWVYEQLLSDRGGFGLVHRLRDTATGTPYAMKTLRPAHLHDVRTRHAFVEEARRLAGLPAHSNLVQAVHFTDWKDQPCLVTEYIEGWPLDALHRRGDTIAAAEGRQTSPQPTSFRTGGLPLVDQLTLFMNISRALGAIWESDSIAHLDLKPANVMIDTSGVARVLDFGLSRTVAALQDGEGGDDLAMALGDEEPPAAADAGDGEGEADAVVSRTFAALTRMSAGRSLFRMAGTLAYMAPEQFMGLDRCDTRTDIYAMGILMYETVSGQLPFRPDPSARDKVGAYARLHRERAVESVPGCDPRLAEIILRCLRKPMGDRYPSFRELFAVLDNIYFTETARKYPWGAGGPENPEDLANRAYILLQCGRDNAEALRLTERAVKLAPEHVRARFVHGVALRIVGRAAEAEPIFARLLAERPDDAETLRQAAIVADALGHSEEALRLHEQVAGLLPNEDECNHGNIASTLTAIAERNRDAVTRGVYLSRARAHIEEGLSAHPESEMLCDQLIEVSRIEDSLAALAERLRGRLGSDWSGFVHSRLGWVCELMASGEEDEGRQKALREEAVSLLNRSVEDNDTSDNYLNRLGIVYDSMSEHDQALDCYDRALALNEADANIAGNKVSSLRQAGRRAEAVAFGEQWLADALHRPTAQLLHQMGLAYEATSKPEAKVQALVCYNRALDLDGTDANIAQRKIEALRDLDRDDDAIAFGAKWVANPSHSPTADVWVQLGVTYELLSRWDEAVNCADEALRITPDSSSAMTSKFRSLCAMRDFTAADNLIQQAPPSLTESLIYECVHCDDDDLGEYTLSMLQRMHERSPMDPLICAGWMDGLRKAGRIEDAVRIGDEWVTNEKGKPNCNFWNALGHAYAKTGRFHQGLERYESWMGTERSGDNFDEFWSILGHTLTTTGETLLRFDGRMDTVVPKRLNSTDGETVPARPVDELDMNTRMQLGGCMYRLAAQASVGDELAHGNHVFQAIKWFHSAGKEREAYAIGRAELAAERTFVMHDWVHVCFAVQDYASALSALDNLLLDESKNRRLPTYEGLYVRVLAALGRTEEAIQFAEPYKTERPGQKDEYFWNNIGTAHCQLKQYAEAITCFDRALALDGADATFAGNKLFSLNQSGRVAEAVAAGERWLACAEHQPNAHFTSQLKQARDVQP